MRMIAAAGLASVLASGLGGCTVERPGPPGWFVSVEEIWVRDDGDELPRVLESRLRTNAGALGANGIVLHPNNRRENGTRVDLDVTLDDPFDYFRATAIWIGEGQPPQIPLGRKG